MKEIGLIGGRGNQDPNIYEIFVNDCWIEVSYSTFRSWSGERRKNGKKFYGRIFYYLSNNVYKIA